MTKIMFIPFSFLFFFQLPVPVISVWAGLVLRSVSTFTTSTLATSPTQKCVSKLLPVPGLSARLPMLNSAVSKSCSEVHGAAKDFIVNQCLVPMYVPPRLPFGSVGDLSCHE